MSLRRQHIARQGMMQKRDGALQTEGELLATVHDSCQGQIGKGEHRPALTDTASIEMLLTDSHLCTGEAIACFYDLRSSTMSKNVTVVQKLL